MEEKELTGKPPMLANVPTEPGVYEVGFEGDDTDVAVVYWKGDRLHVRVNAADCRVEDFMRYGGTPPGKQFYWGKRIEGDAVYARIAEQFAKERAWLNQKHED